MRVRAVQRVIFLFVVVLAACAVTPERLGRFEFYETHMGSKITIVLFAPTQEKAEAAAREAFAVVGAIDACMSDYKPDSELSRLGPCAGRGPQPVSPMLFEVLQAAEKISKVSDGAFDVTVGPVVQLWRRARKTLQVPDEADLKQALGCVGFDRLKLDASKQTATLETPGMRLDVGGIAKGYASDRALAVLKRRALARAYVGCAGDLALGDPPPDQKGWRIRIEDGPILRIANCGVSTSGDTERFVEIDGRHYSHIVNPRTGMGIEGMTMVTVVAADGTVADGLATALSVLGPERGLALAKKMNVQARFNWRELSGPGNKKKWHLDTTPGFNALVLPE